MIYLDKLNIMINRVKVIIGTTGDIEKLVNKFLDENKTFKMTDGTVSEMDLLNVTVTSSSVAMVASIAYKVVPKPKQ